jgi:hypothetical protein
MSAAARRLGSTISTSRFSPTVPITSQTATTVDEEEPQLLCQKLLDERVASIDDALARFKQILPAST